MHTDPHFGTIFLKNRASPLAPLTLAAVPWLRLQEPLAWPLLVICSSSYRCSHSTYFAIPPLQAAPPPPSSCNPSVHAIPSASNPPLQVTRPLDATPAPHFTPCHRPPHQALQGTQVALPYDDMGTTATDALDGAIMHCIVLTFVLTQIL